MKHTKANAFKMGDSILEEGKAANKEGRIPSSTNAIAIFRKKSKAKLSTSEVHELFDFVFKTFHGMSKGKAYNSISNN